MAPKNRYSFQQDKSPDHDKLLCECTSTEGAEIIILEALGSFPIIEFFKTYAKESRKKFLSHIKDQKKHLTYGDRLTLEFRLLEDVDYLDTLVDTLDDEIITLLPNYFRCEIKDIAYNYEPEKLVMVSDKDLYGYADLIINFNVCIVPRLVDIPHVTYNEILNHFPKDLADDIYEKHCAQCEHLNDFSENLTNNPERYAIKKSGTILVELKPKITDIGAVLRQVKTYREYLPDITNTVIATFSEVSDDIRQIVKHENVTIVVFEGEVKEDVRSPKQAYELQYSPQQAYAMSRIPPSEKQLNFLHQLGYKGEVASSLEASAKIEDLKSKKNDTFG